MNLIISECLTISLPHVLLFLTNIASHHFIHESNNCLRVGVPVSRAVPNTSCCVSSHYFIVSHYIVNESNCLSGELCLTSSSPHFLLCCTHYISLIASEWGSLSHEQFTTLPVVFPAVWVARCSWPQTTAFLHCTYQQWPHRYSIGACKMLNVL